MELTKYFKTPSVISIVGDPNTCKSNLIYHIIETLKKEGKFNLYAFGLRYNIGTQINSIDELEKIEDSIIILDEFFSLLDLDDRKKKKQIENTLRLIFHNNNILILCGVAENFKKFLSNKINYVFFNQVTYGDFINGSRIKKIALNYRGAESGSNILKLKKGETLFFDGNHYNKLNIPYLAKYDSKANNKVILNVVKNVVKSVPKNVEKKRSKMCVQKIFNPNYVN